MIPEPLPDADRDAGPDTDPAGEHPLVPALAALVAGDRERAAALAAAVERDSPSLLSAALARHLGVRAPEDSVYVDPAAFAAFIGAGGNVGLYAATSAALAAQLDRSRPGSLLDVGCGDGAALVPALAASGWRPDRVEVAEPSPALLAGAQERLAAAGVSARAWPLTLQALLVEPGAGPWDLVEATFALHALPTDERTEALAALRPRTGRLAVVEFDVPAAAVGSPEHLAFLARTYERGLAEYEAGGERDLVADGFLMPVLVGQLAPGAVRATWEQPADAWVAQLRAAGWHDVVAEPLHDYWSSPAFLLTARGGA